MAANKGKKDDLKVATDDQLQTQLIELKREQFNLRFQSATNQLEKPSRVREVRRTIGVALQEAALDPLMTGRELIRLQATLQGIPTAEGRERADALLDRVGL